MPFLADAWVDVANMSPDLSTPPSPPRASPVTEGGDGGVELLRVLAGVGPGESHPERHVGPGQGDDRGSGSTPQDRPCGQQPGQHRAGDRGALTRQPPRCRAPV